MSTPAKIDRAAPVIARHEIDIQAPPDVVWRVHIDVNAWPTWHPDITDANLAEPFEPGNSFEWTSYGFVSPASSMGPPQRQCDGTTVMGSGLRSTVTQLSPAAADEVRARCTAEIVRRRITELTTSSRYGLATLP